MGFGRKFNRNKQQQQTHVLQAPLAKKPLEPTPANVYKALFDAGNVGYDKGFDDGYRRCMAQILIGVGYILLFHFDSLKIKSIRLRVFFEMLVVILNEYEETSMMREVYDEYRRQGVDSLREYKPPRWPD